MAKNSAKTGYISRGQRPNVSRKISNLIRRERRLNRPLEDILKRYFYKKGIIDKPRGQKEKELRERYLEEERISLQAFKLIDQYREVGLPKSVAVHAVMTNYTDQVHTVWGPKLQKFLNLDKASRNNLNKVK